MIQPKRKKKSKTSPKVAVKAYNGLKRLFFDIETSYCQGWFWRTGWDISISNNQILKPSAIICICYKWEGESKVHSLTWNNGDDRQMILEFIDILNDAEETITHNGDKFDIRWFRTRCLMHGVRSMPSITSTDTLKIARQKFVLSSNKLNDIGELLGLGGKMDTGGIQLWHDIIQDNNQTSLNKMVKYCKRDVELLEEVYNSIKGFCTLKTHAGIKLGLGACSCPSCASPEYSVSKHRVTASGIKKVQLQCKSCGSYHTVSEKALLMVNK